MATAATLDTIRNNSQTETKNGWRILRTAVVTGATGSGPAKIFNAAALGTIPQIGDAHPEITAAKVTSRLPRAVGAGVVEIAIVYEEDRKKKTDAEDPTGDGGASVQVGTRLQSEYTNLDRDGNFVVLTLSGDPPPPPQPGGVNVLKPQTTINIARREATDPSDKSADFVGSVNGEGQFAIAGSKQQAGTWLCTAIEGAKEVAGTYIVSYSFELKEKAADGTGGWQPEVIYIDPKTGLPHVKVAGEDATDADKASGRKTFLAYREKNFNSLQLTE